MKKTFYALLLALLIVPVLVQNVDGISVSLPTGLGLSDDPGDGFDSNDDCGYVYGVADRYPATAGAIGEMDFDSVGDSNQGCVDENGYFYSDSDTESYGFYTRSTYSGTTFRLDFDYSAASNVHIDPATGEWSGAAYILNSSVPVGQHWVDFDWTCSTSCTSDPDDYHVYTDMNTGEISGYAWSDYFNDYISFNGLMMELPAQQIVPYVSIISYDGTTTPLAATSVTAPLADGAEYWDVTLQFYDPIANRYLTSSEVTNVTIVPQATSDSNVYFNQVEDTGNAIRVTYVNTLLGCTSTTSVCTTSTSGEDTFHTFIFGGAPTSNMLGLNSDADADIEYYSDREGCRWIYADQGTGSRTPTGVADCPDGAGSSSVPDKDLVFADRRDDINKYEIESVEVTFELTGSRDLSVQTSSSFEEVDTNTWQYTPDAGSANLSFRPRFRVTQYTAEFDSASHTSISSDPNKVMSLKTLATMSNTSSLFQTRMGVSQPDYSVTNQMDVTGASATSDTYLLIDTDAPPNSPTSGDVEATYRTDSFTAGASYNTYNKNYAIAYGQKASFMSTCGTPGFGACTSGTNSYSDPTAEQWVCDEATEYTLGNVSCYYTEYLPHVDPHDDPQSMLVIGAINSVIDADDLLDTISEETETPLSILGTTETINLRNKMYAQVARYTLGQTGAGGSFDSSGTASGPTSLMGGRLYYTKNADVTINGFSGVDKTLVVIGGDVYINSNIDTGHMGIIVFKQNGVGGNVYVSPDVTDLWVNLFLDGSLFSNSGTTDSSGTPVWANADARVETLLNQLYLKGSVVSRNTVGGSTDSDGDGYYELGDGTSTTSEQTAQEYDLNMIRQYRLCHPVVAGVVDYSVTEECADGQLLSDYLIEEEGYKPYSLYNSFILDYDPADQLPIFEVESGLFN